jgi:Domain of unknown function (DUF4129)
LALGLAEAEQVAPIRQCSANEYRQHLRYLQDVVADCSENRTAEKCDPARVGPDDQVSTADGIRLVEFVWLRSVLERAAGPQGAKERSGAEPETAGLLADAVHRLRQEEQAPFQEGKPRNLTAARQALSMILASNQFHHVEQPSILGRLLNAFLQWAGQRLSQIAAYRSHARWMTRLFFLAVIFAACTGLIWWFLRQTRQQGLALPPSRSSLRSAAFARDWKLCFEDAQQLASAGRWREAIHAVYWAAIARLEARAVWPADGARTPREYLSLLDQESEQRRDLIALTRSFESIWYGHYPAGEPEYQRACRVLERLASR